MLSNGCTTIGSSGSRSSTAGREPSATACASIGASVNEAICMPVSASKSDSVAHQVPSVSGDMPLPPVPVVPPAAPVAPSWPAPNAPAASSTPRAAAHRVFFMGIRYNLRAVP